MGLLFINQNTYLLFTVALKSRGLLQQTMQPQANMYELPSQVQFCGVSLLRKEPVITGLLWKKITNFLNMTKILI